MDIKTKLEIIRAYAIRIYCEDGLWDVRKLNWATAAYNRLFLPWFYGVNSWADIPEEPYVHERLKGDP